MAMCC